MILKKLKSEKEFLRLLMILAIPIILQSFITTSLNLLDNIMVGKLGEKEIAAVGLSNQFYLIFFYCVSGIAMGGSILISQLFGKKEIERIKETLDLAVIIIMFIAIIFTSIAVSYPDKIIEFFIKDADIIELGVGYLKTVAVSYLFSALTLSFSVALRSTGQTKIPMYGSLIGIAFNGIMNYILIFVKLGFPRLGVVGAALGTTIARGMELLFILLIVYKYDNIIKTNFKSLKSLTKERIRNFFKGASPVALNDAMWILGISMYSLAYVKLGISATATMQIANTINSSFYIFAIGIGYASSILIGNKIGEGRIDEAFDISKKITKVGILLGVITGAIFFILSPFVISIFKVTPETAEKLLKILKFMSFIIPVRFYVVLQIIGVLRGGGDVIYSTVTEMIGIWGIGIPLAFLSIHIIPNLDVTLLYPIICFEELIKILILLPRVRTRKWIKQLT